MWTHQLHCIRLRCWCIPSVVQDENVWSWKTLTHFVKEILFLQRKRLYIYFLHDVQSHTQSPKACWTVVGCQERLENLKKITFFSLAAPLQLALFYRRNPGVIKFQYPCLSWGPSASQKTLKTLDTGLALDYNNDTESALLFFTWIQNCILWNWLYCI